VYADLEQANISNQKDVLLFVYTSLLTNKNIPDTKLVCGVKTTFHIFDMPIALERLSLT